MKKFLKISLLFVMTILMGGVVCSCGDDDNEVPTPENQTSNADSLVGKWNASIGKSIKYTLVFKENGTGSLTSSGDNLNGNFTFSWKRKTVTVNDKEESAVVITITNGGETDTATLGINMTNKAMLCLYEIEEEDEDSEEDMSMSDIVFYKEGAAAKDMYPFLGTWSDINEKTSSKASITLKEDGKGTFSYTNYEDESSNISTEFIWRMENLVVTDERGYHYHELSLVISAPDGTNTGAYCYSIEESGALRIWPMMGQEEYFGGPIDVEEYWFRQ